MYFGRFFCMSFSLHSWSYEYPRIHTNNRRTLKACKHLQWARIFKLIWSHRKPAKKNQISIHTKGGPSCSGSFLHLSRKAGLPKSKLVTVGEPFVMQNRGNYTDDSAKSRFTLPKEPKLQEFTPLSMFPLLVYCAILESEPRVLHYQAITLPLSYSLLAQVLNITLRHKGWKGEREVTASQSSPSEGLNFFVKK